MWSAVKIPGKVALTLLAWNFLECVLKVSSVLNFLVWFQIVWGFECGCEFLFNCERT